ncbi:pyroglutamyl-peptidase [Tepidamorphus gemmatus]|uniref:Pyroglutamyl-peptidase I n=1 Tax=Tepidamorphus gemmatus TaxID=747076 RepID=A0A4R3LUI2_9HYPH|nr:pyroglutamyl-peptidase I [Tepidamorphus gemmatus]TCT04141.1 pyroglutamyl-peptidase [Tepidamorphus gemmatus]
MALAPRILVTGFSAFPGARSNPSEGLVAGLAVEALSSRLGIALATAVLPTEYDGVGEQLPRLWRDLAPDAVIHFGLAGRARHVRLETCGRNACAPFRPDAAGRLPRGHVIEPGGPILRRVTLPVAWIAAAFARQGIPATISVDAGRYLCNVATYLSLAIAAQAPGPKPLVGFVHLPWPREERIARAPSDRPGWSQLAQAVETAIAVTALKARRRTAPLP